MNVTVAHAMADVSAAEWDALAHHDNPFVEHKFLVLLETSRSVGKKTAWQPRHLLLREAGKLVAAMPCYKRGDSYGEYIFDWAWAQAAARAGIPYYPKLTCAVPFVPATGPRVLVHPDADADVTRTTLAQALVELAREESASSAHVLFCRDDEATTLSAAGLARRTSLQFHWRNAGWTSFDGFLDALRSEDRKQIRRERRRVVESGVAIEVMTGDEVPPALWPELFALYTSTSDRKWGSPYLTRAFFEGLGDQRALVVTARRNGTLVAMTLSFERGQHIYGRHWGCFEEIPGLHFELCYYQLIERAVARGATLVEAGAQGEHKLKRGFLPVVTHSLHHIEEPALAAAVKRYLRAERDEVLAQQAELLEHSPFKEGAAPDAPLVAGVGGR